MKGDTYIYDGHLYLTGDIRKGTFNATSGAWTEQKNLNNYFVMKGVKSLHCLDINNTTELLELHYDAPAQEGLPPCQHKEWGQARARVHAAS